MGQVVTFSSVTLGAERAVSVIDLETELELSLALYITLTLVYDV